MRAKQLREEVRNEIHPLLQSTTLREVIGDKKDIYVLSSEATVEAALKQLSTHRIRGAPVFSPDGSVQFLDYIDLQSFLADLLVQGGHDKVSTNLESGELFHTFISTHLSKVANYSKRNVHVVGDLSWNLDQVLQHFISGVKRIIVMQSHQIVNIATDTDVLGFLQKHVGTLPAFKHTIADIGIGSSHVTMVKEDIPAVEAFLQMNRAKLSAIPILDEEGEVLSVLSARDLQLLMHEGNPSKLKENVMDFVQTSRQVFPVAKDTYPYFWIKKESTLETTIKRLCATHVHRLILIEDKKPVGVVSVADIIGLLAGKQ